MLGYKVDASTVAGSDCELSCRMIRVFLVIRLERRLGYRIGARIRLQAQSQEIRGIPGYKIGA
jgi:hypothetical protein